MKKDLIKNMDPRPKRRKDKDNPYELISVGDGTENAAYYITFQNGNGEKVCEQVSRDLFMEFDRMEREDLHFLNEKERHIEMGEVNENIPEREMIEPLFLEKAEIDELYAAISELSPLQRDRLRKYYFDDMTLKQIADIDGCSMQSVLESIKSAIIRIRQLLR